MPACERLDAILVELFRRLHTGGLLLGLGELFAAQEAVAKGFGTADREQLRRTLTLLWSKAPAQGAELDIQLDAILAEQSGPEPIDADVAENDPATPRDQPPPVEPPSQQMCGVAAQPTPSPSIAPVPIRTPDLPVHEDHGDLLVSQRPVSRRSMSHSWRYLRQPVKDGPCNRIDLSATIERVARLGYFDRPAMQRAASDHSHLVLLIDQGGSMVPFHRFTRDLVRTAGEGHLGRLDVGYFQNVPPKEVYLDPHRTRSIPIDRLLEFCGPDSSILVVSDAGAARGHREIRRFKDTVLAIARLKRFTSQFAWLNPVPSPRWHGTTAQLIALKIDMFPMDDDGLSNAIDVLRGQPMSARQHR